MEFHHVEIIKILVVGIFRLAVLGNKYVSIGIKKNHIDVSSQVTFKKIGPVILFL